PTLVLHGAQEPLIDVSNGRLLAAQIPHSRLEIVGDGGDLIIFDQPAECAAVMNTFLAEQRSD
ncbi:alpha/beta fold hydrolase, partial [Actinomycetospora atypica]